MKKEKASNVCNICKLTNFTITSNKIVELVPIGEIRKAGSGNCTMIQRGSHAVLFEKIKTNLTVIQCMNHKLKGNFKIFPMPVPSFLTPLTTSWATLTVVSRGTVTKNNGLNSSASSLALLLYVD